MWVEGLILIKTSLKEFKDESLMPVHFHVIGARAPLENHFLNSDADLEKSTGLISISLAQK